MATITQTQTVQETTESPIEPYFSMGLRTHRVPMSLHRENRMRLIDRFGDAPAHSVLLLRGGEQQTRYGTDHEPVFRQESYFQHLFGVKEPDCFGAINLDTKESILFVPRLPASYAVWMGKIQSTEFFRNMYGVDKVLYTDEVAKFHEEAKTENVFVLRGLNTDSGEIGDLEAKFEQLDEKYKVDRERLHKEATELRVIKTAKELDVMRYVCRISSEAHIKVMQAVRPGMTEYQLESIFRHHCYHEGGCRKEAYTCICAAGVSSATLHYGHAGAPNDREIQDGEMCLLDMGGEYHCYDADITCSYPANGKFTDDQKLIYNAVLAAQTDVFAALRPGVSWVDMHMVAERAILRHLVEGGILKGDIDEMMAVRLGAVFQPHGLGHFLGLDTHDVGGYPEGVQRREEPGLRSLRTARTLAAGMVVTVEPGCYFLDVCLDEALADPAREKFFNRDVLQRFRTFGGVRLEDDVIITEDGMENMTDCPRTIEDVEAVMAGAEWPRKN